MIPHPTALARVVLALLILTGVSARPIHAAPASFSDVTPAIMNDPNYYGEGVAWGDFDGDGRIDLLVANEGQILALFRNLGGGAFARVMSYPFNTPGNYTGVAWGDFDNDGRLDLFAAEAFARHHLFHNDGGGAFTDLGYGALYDTVHTHGVAWADFDRDGDIDVFYATADAPSDRLFRNDGGGAFADVTPPPMQDPQYGGGVSWADYDGDGDPDLCVANFGLSRLFRNDGGGVFADATPAALATPGHAGGVAWGDYDNDGDFDLFAGEAFGASSRLLRNDGAGAFANVTPPLLAPATDIIGPQWADYDNDGDLDLYLGNLSGPNALFRNEGSGAFSDVTNAALADPGATVGFAWADYDEDGDLDLFVANRGQPDHLLRNDLAGGGHWLELDLVGTESNRSAIDARVEVVTGSRRQIRKVEGGSGYNSQNALRVHFGLGAAATADSVVIRWPSGIVQDSAGVAGDQILTVVEHPQIVGVPPAPGPARLRLLAPAPNPSRGNAAIRYELTTLAAVELSVHDLAGRVVRVLARGTAPPGRHEAGWDGRDGAGRGVTPGVYLVRLAAGGELRTARLVRLR